MLAKVVGRSCTACVRSLARAGTAKPSILPHRILSPNVSSSTTLVFSTIAGQHQLAPSRWMTSRVPCVLPQRITQIQNSTSMQCLTLANRGKISHGAKAMSTNPSASTPQSIVNLLPPSIQPYALLARLDKPIGTWLLLWPCMWSIGIVAPVGALPDLWMMTKFSIGAFVMRGAGCTINDLWDTDIDGKVERTKTRPLAAGTVSKPQAIAFLGLQLTAGLAVLLSLNVYSILLGAASMGLVIIYPLMKRVTNWPQFVLGLTFNWGALLGASAVLGSCPWHVCLPMYLGCVNWTLMYDTIYAHQETPCPPTHARGTRCPVLTSCAGLCQDKRDDVKVGVKSTALLLGSNTKPALVAFSSCFLAGMLGAGHAAGAGLVYYSAVGAAGCHLAWQIQTVDLDNPAACMAKFVSNSQLGAAVCAGIVLDKLVFFPLLF